MNDCNNASIEQIRIAEIPDTLVRALPALKGSYQYTPRKLFGTVFCGEGKGDPDAYLEVPFIAERAWQRWLQS